MSKLFILDKIKIYYINLIVKILKIYFLILNNLLKNLKKYKKTFIKR